MDYYISKDQFIYDHGISNNNRILIVNGINYYGQDTTFWLWGLFFIYHYPRLENYNNFWLVKTPGIRNPYSRVLLGYITGCN